MMTRIDPMYYFYNQQKRARHRINLCTALSILLMSVSQAHAQADAASAVVKLEKPSSTTSRPPLISGPWDIDAFAGEITMFVGETRVLKKPSVARIAVGNGKILSAAVLEDNEILLIANQEGTSVLHVWIKDGRSARLKITILPQDMSRVSSEIVKFLSSIPKVTTTVVGDKVLVDGEDLSDRDLDKLKELSGRFPQIVNFTGKVGWEKMVYMDVKVVEFKKDKLRDVGILWDKEVQGPTFASVGAPLANDLYRPIGSIQGESSLPLRVRPFQSYFGIVTQLNSRIRLSENKGDAVVLASPRLAARSGSEAEFHVGGEIPFATIRDQMVNITYKPYGLKLQIKPRMDNTGAVRSSIEAEISAIDPSVTVMNGVPALTTRKVNTEFNVRAGETMVIAGLINRQKSDSADQIPVLGSIPIIGSLFRSRNTQDRETEIVIFVTPTVVTSDERSAEFEKSLTNERKRVEDKVDLYLNPPPPPPPPPTPEPDPFDSLNQGG